MQRQTFPSSTAVASAMYDETTQDLTVTFRNGRSYTYANVPPDTWDQFVNADSPGRFVRVLGDIYG